MGHKKVTLIGEVKGNHLAVSIDRPVRSIGCNKVVKMSKKEYEEQRDAEEVYRMVHAKGMNPFFDENVMCIDIEDKDTMLPVLVSSSNGLTSSVYIPAKYGQEEIRGTARCVNDIIALIDRTGESLGEYRESALEVNEAVRVLCEELNTLGKETELGEHSGIGITEAVLLDSDRRIEYAQFRVDFGIEEPYYEGRYGANAEISVIKTSDMSHMEQVELIIKAVSDVIEKASFIKSIEIICNQREMVASLKTVDGEMSYTTQRALEQLGYKVICK